MGLNMNQGSRQGFRDEQTDYFFYVASIHIFMFDFVL